MNALRDFAGILGGAADAVFLGGAVGKTNRRNAFADYIGKGDYAAAEQLALRNGEGGYAQLAQQKAAGATAAQEREAAKQKEQFEFIQRSAAFLDTLTPEQQKGYLDVNGRGLIAQGVLDEDDLPLLYQNIGVAGGFTGLAQTSLGVQAQFDNSLNTRKQGEVERSAQATERLRGGELAVSQGNLALGRDRLGEDRRQFDATQAGKVSEQNRKLAESTDAVHGAIAARGQRVQLIANKLDEAIGQVRGGLDGTAGRNAFLSNVPGTQAKNLSATLDTIKANIGFEELQRMRDNSPTGGALGQVTEKEIAFLQSVLGSLDQGQSPQQLRENLQRAKTEIIASWERVRQAYEQDYGVQYQGPGSGAAQPSQGGGISDGATATNPQTGQRIIFRNGQWEPM